jgi:hypothetical protein
MPKLYSLLITLQIWTWRDTFAAAFLIWVAYYVAVGIYRVYFHPLAKFPGPKVISQCLTLLPTGFWRRLLMQQLRGITELPKIT